MLRASHDRGHAARLSILSVRMVLALGISYTSVRWRQVSSSNLEICNASANDEEPIRRLCLLRVLMLYYLLVFDGLLHVGAGR